MSWPCLFKFLNGFYFLDPSDRSVSVVLSHSCLPASWLIHFNLPSLAQNTRDAIQPAKRGAGQIEF